jgi:hydrogenase maturation protein HypF
VTVPFPPPVERWRLTLRGAVQGVGFRPLVYRLAREGGLSGWVLNSSAGLVVEVEGAPGRLQGFLDAVEREMPAAAVLVERDFERLRPEGSTIFEIRLSEAAGEKTASVLPDLATCPECLAEVLAADGRRAGYPFTNCTHCGPRYTIILDIPYDRARTTMERFTMCAACRREYEDPRDRRFHAQPNACPRCGPQLEPAGLDEAAAALRAGRIVALKGTGGFQLLVDARQPDAVDRLRHRKHREQKPFALLMPSLEEVRRYCRVSLAERALLESAAAPIVLLEPNGEPGIADNVAPGSPYLGVMLPYSPLHHLLMRECPFPLVATSGNRSDEPIAIGNEEARERLGGIADVFVLHDRPVARPCDDSVARIARGKPSVIRRARGYAPLPVKVGWELAPVLAVGGHLKNTVAIAIGNQVYLSQHIGDLDTQEAREAFRRAIDDLCRLYEFEPELVACDLHPDYASTAWARASGLPVAGVQHHHAHAAACAAENGVCGAYLGVAWDGTGYGLDSMVWGSEFFIARDGAFERVAHLRPFRLPGGEAAAREPWRCAASLLLDIGKLPPGDDTLRRMIERGVNSPLTTSMGRLFDAAAVLTGCIARETRNQFEGQAAMTLEREARRARTTETYPLPGGDWREVVVAMVADVAAGREPAVMAAKFHNALARWILSVAEEAGEQQVVLSGGVFQNGILLERASTLLEDRGFRVFTHRAVPANDGGLALGQAVLAGQIGTSLCA